MESIKRQKNEECIQSFLSASRDVKLIIMKLLDVCDLASLFVTSSQMRLLSCDKRLWVFLLQRDYNIRRDPVFDIDITSKEIYKHHKSFKFLMSTIYCDCNSIFIWACKHGSTNTMKCCLRKGANVNFIDRYGQNFLHFAVMNVNLEAIEILINKGIHVNKPNHKGYTPLIISSMKYDENITNSLIKAGANVNTTNWVGNSPLMCAAKKGYKPNIEILLENGANINESCFKYGYTPLMLAGKNNKVEAVALLVKLGANINMTDNIGYSCLMWACNDKYNDIVDVLLDGGADTKITTSAGINAYMIAKSKGHNEIAEKCKIVLKKYLITSVGILTSKNGKH